MAFLIDTHVHTSQTSRCGRSSAEEMVDAYKAAGFDAIVVTDHFVNGNSNCPREAPWKERMDVFFSGYHAALAHGKRVGLIVLCGWEWAYHGEDYLTFGLDEAFLYAHPEAEGMTPEEYGALVRANGGFFTRAHPFREAAYIEHRTVQRPEIVEGIEIVNGGHMRSGHPEFDALAREQCAQFGRIATAGSDAHHVSEAGMTGMAFEKPFDTQEGFLRALRAGEGHVLPDPKYA